MLGNVTKNIKKIVDNSKTKSEYNEILKITGHDFLKLIKQKKRGTSAFIDFNHQLFNIYLSKHHVIFKIFNKLAG